MVISKLYQIMVGQILLYEHENLTLQKQEGRRFEPANFETFEVICWT